MKVEIPRPPWPDPDLSGRSVDSVMLRAPRTLPDDATLGEARAALTDDHVHLVLLLDGDVLTGTLGRRDVKGPEPDDAPALASATLRDRTVGGTTDAVEVHRAMVQQGVRRLAVVGEGGRLLGLLCLKRSGTGFCSDQDVRDRSCGRA